MRRFNLIFEGESMDHFKQRIFAAVRRREEVGLLAEPRTVGVTASSPTLQHVQAQGGGICWRGPGEVLLLQTAVHRKSLLAWPVWLYSHPCCGAQARGGVSHCWQLQWRPSGDLDKHAIRLPGRLSGPLSNVVLLDGSPVRGTQKGCSAW